MKKSLLFSVLTVSLFVACNNDATTDSSSQTSTTDSTVTTAPSDNGSVTPGSSASMMEIMNRNMQEMKAMPSTGNPDNDFASMMKTHHMGALEMAQVEAAQGTDAGLKAMAQKMIDAQQAEIAELNTFLSGHQAHGGGEGFHKEVMSQMNDMKMEMDHSGSIDKQFAQMMIPHHQGAIDMATAYLKSGAHEEKLKTMASKIINDQKAEIEALKTWLSKN